MIRFFRINVILLLFIPVICHSQNPSRWRGPNENGYYPDTGLLKVWPTGGPQVLWHYDKLGEGFSSPAFGNGMIYTSGMEKETGYVYALRQDGSLVWKAPYGSEFLKSYPGSRGTPVIDGDHLYILSGMGRLSCLSSNSGQLLWTKDLFQEFGGRNTEWGLAETPVIHGDKLICTPGGKIHNVIALNKYSGDLIWTTKGMGEIPAYCTPLLIEIGGRNLLITHTAKNIIGVDADKGDFLWHYPHVNIYDIHPNTPVYHDGQVFCFSGYGKGGVMLRLNEDGSEATKMWFCETMDSRIGGAVYMDGYLYGSGDKNREWQCIDWSSGQVKYESKELGNGVVIAAEGLLYIYSQRGELALVKPGSLSFEIISEIRVAFGSGQHWAHPVINEGRLFVRHGNALIAYKIR